MSASLGSGSCLVETRAILFSTLALAVGFLVAYFLLRSLDFSEEIIERGREQDKAEMTTPLPQWTPTAHTPWQMFRRDPVISVAQWLHSHRPAINAVDTCVPGLNRIRLVCISDTHNVQPLMPYGDILLHAGDLTNNGTFSELQSQIDWLASLPHPHKVVIAGNHDRLLDVNFVNEHPERMLDRPDASQANLDWHDIIYLENSSVTISFPPSQEGAVPTTLKIYGSPLTPLCGTFAFQYPPVRDVWRDRLPIDADIVLVHGPPRGYLDCPGKGYKSKGCPHLIRELSRVQPKVVVFGHIHSGFGREDIQWTKGESKYFSRLVGMDEGQQGRELPGWILVFLLAYGLATAWAEALVSRATGGRWKYPKHPKFTTMVNAAVRAEMGHDQGVVVEI